MENSVFWDMMMLYGSCKNDVSEEHIASIFRLKGLLTLVDTFDEAMAR
jgi:hypothetical protein